MKRFFVMVLGACFMLCGCASTGSTSTASPSAAADVSEEASATQEEAEEAATESASAETSAAVSASSEGLIVFAAASLQETLDEIGQKYGEETGTSIEFNFDSSGTLKTQIEEGAECDIFISAAPKQMNELEEADEIATDTRMDLLENKVVLAVEEGNPSGLTSFEDLAERLKAGDILIAIGNEDVPVGQYTQEIFEYLGLNEEELAASGVLSYGTNVKEVTTQVQEGSVDAGIIYATDAFSAQLEAVAEATSEMCSQVIYPAAVLAKSADPDAARAFLDYLTTPEAAAVFEGVGFTVLAGD